MQIDRTVGKRKRRRRVKRWVCVCGLRRASVLGLEWPLKSEHSEREREREREMQWDLSEGKATSSVLLRSKRPIVFWIYIVFPLVWV